MRLVIGRQASSSRYSSVRKGAHLLCADQCGLAAPMQRVRRSLTEGLLSLQAPRGRTSTSSSIKASWCFMRREGMVVADQKGVILKMGARMRPRHPTADAAGSPRSKALGAAAPTSARTVLDTNFCEAVEPQHEEALADHTVSPRRTYTRSRGSTVSLGLQRLCKGNATPLVIDLVKERSLCPLSLAI